MEKEFIYGVGDQDETDFGSLDYFEFEDLPEEIKDEEAIFEIYNKSGDLYRMYTNEKGWL